MALEGICMAPEIERTEDRIRPPRWADALLRSFLTPGNAEAISGDLLEAYRDSIRPLRGRRRADLWYIQQVVGCMLRTTTPMNLRNRILAGLTLAFLILVFSSLMYSSPPSYPIDYAFLLPEAHVRFGLVGITAGLLFYAYAAVWRTRAATREDELVLRLGAKWGLAIGTVWIVAYIRLTMHALDGWLLALTAWALPFICGVHGAIKTWKMRDGMRVGFWSGLVSGLMVFLAFAVVGYIVAFVPGLLGAEISGEFQSKAIFNSLAMGISHLFVVGGVLGTFNGMIAGCASILLARTGLTPEERQERASR